jgi:uncharacterized membrane protein YoaK (UPF0700 family)
VTPLRDLSVGLVRTALYCAQWFYTSFMSGDGPGLGFGAAAGLVALFFVGNGAAWLGATFVTGTLFAAGQDLARGPRGKRHAGARCSICRCGRRFAPAH